MALRPWEAALLALLAALLVMGAVNGIPSVFISPEPVEPAPEQFVALDDRGPVIWPYVAAGRSFDRPTSPINLVFAASPVRVQHMFVRGLEDVNVTEGSTPDHPPGIEWRVLESAPRYVYVTAAEDAHGEWRDPVYQLHHGSYFGSQSHLRVYDASIGSDGWTVVQAHAEHWDWFAMTHRVDSVERPRAEIEEVLFEDRSVREVRRVYYDNGGTSDADGWTTVVLLAVLVTVSIDSIVPGRPVDRQRLLLLGAVASVPLLVRILGVLAGEVGLPRDPVSWGLYIVLAVGTPIVTVLTGRRIPSWEAFSLAAGGFATAVVLDYTYLDVHVLQLGIVAHRTMAAVAIGLLAAGSVAGDDRRDPRLIAGIVLWLVALVTPHVPI